MPGLASTPVTIAILYCTHTLVMQWMLKLVWPLPAKQRMVVISSRNRLADGHTPECCKTSAVYTVCDPHELCVPTCNVGGSVQQGICKGT
jgi:hypothetical protein